MNNSTYSSEDKIILESDRLTVEIAQPGTIYRGSRFDWTGFITQVTLDHQHNFCVPEQYDPDKGTGGIGFCNEFGIDKPVGYEEAAVGECFPKIGIGLLKRKSEGPYEFWSSYDIQAFSVQVSTEENSVTFVSEPFRCAGYAARLEKTVSIKGTILEMEYTLKNTGIKHIETNEYCHNFIGIDGHHLGKDYCLSFPYQVKINKVSGSFVPYEDKILWEEAPQGDFYGIIERIGVEPEVDPYWWQLIHTPSGAGVRELTRIPVCKYAVWGSTHVVSPELFIHISLEPGAAMTWSRKYEFFC